MSNLNYRMKNKIQSNVQLQILLHFNIFLFILWIILHIFYYQRIEIIQYCQQVFKNDDLYVFLRNASFTLLTIVEFGRLYAGYYGNRLEKIQYMIAFIFLSTTFQLPNHLFRLITIECWYHHVFIPEIISNLLLLLMTLAEIIFSVWHLKIILEKIYQQQQQQESQQTTSVSKNDDKHQQQYVGYDNC
ncbi:transmembrane protein 17B-like [Dermatophagoides farinae]|uniref:transmembrane protein 17B-like n=1 Tax=Dermatophagoides farinae TaxID=6954 RepID=UPI003F616FBC